MYGNKIPGPGLSIRIRPFPREWRLVVHPLDDFLLQMDDGVDPRRLCHPHRVVRTNYPPYSQFKRIAVMPLFMNQPVNLPRFT